MWGANCKLRDLEIYLDYDWKRQMWISEEKKEKEKEGERKGKEGGLTRGTEIKSKNCEHQLAIWWYEGIIDNFVYCDTSIVVMFYKSHNLLDIYTEIFIDEICC